MELRRLIDSGMSVREVAVRLGVSRQVVYKRLSEAGLRPRATSRKCANCGTRFASTRSWAQYCSQGCQYISWRRRTTRAKRIARKEER